MLLTRGNLFTPVNLQHRVFSKVSRVSDRDTILSLNPKRHEYSNGRLNLHWRLRELTFDSIPLGLLLVDLKGNLLLVNKTARLMFNISLGDLGRPFQDLEISYRPIELRSHIEQVYTEKLPVSLIDVCYHLSEEEVQYLEIQVNPLLDENNQMLGVSISFV